MCRHDRANPPSQGYPARDVGEAELKRTLPHMASPTYSERMLTGRYNPGVRRPAHSSRLSKVYHPPCKFV